MKWEKSAYPISRLYNGNQGCLTLVKGKMLTQWNRTEIDPHKYSQLILGKAAKATHQRKDDLFNKWSWRNWHMLKQANKKNLNLVSWLIQNGSWTYMETTKLVGKKKEREHLQPKTRQEFLIMAPKEWARKENNGSIGLHQI